MNKNRNNYKDFSRPNIVSPVMATLISLVVIILVTICFIYMTGIFPHEESRNGKENPWIDMTMEERPNGYLVTMHSVKRQYPNIMSVHYYVLNTNNNVVIDGNLIDIFGVNLAFVGNESKPVKQVSLFGNTSVFLGGKIHPGAQIFFSKEAFPDGIGGLKIRLKYIPSNVVISWDIKFDKAIWNPIEFSYFSSYNNTNFHSNNSNITSISRNITSHVLYFEGVSLELNFLIKNAHITNYSNLTFHLFYSNNNTAILSEENLTFIQIISLIYYSLQNYTILTIIVIISHYIINFFLLLIH